LATCFFFRSKLSCIRKSNSSISSLSNLQICIYREVSGRLIRAAQAIFLSHYIYERFRFLLCGFVID
jgi:hypothetical protein